MLRHVMEDADSSSKASEDGAGARDKLVAVTATTSTALTKAARTTKDYGATTMTTESISEGQSYRQTQQQQQQQRQTQQRQQAQQQQDDGDDDDEDDDEEEEEGDYLLDDDDDDDDEDEDDPRPEPLLHKCWRLIKECFLVVINVDNLYDEDGMIMTPNGSRLRTASTSPSATTTLLGTDASAAADFNGTASPAPTRRNHFVVFFWFCVLAISYGLERSSFKLLVDRAGPFRLFSVFMVTGAHVVILSIGMAISAYLHRRQQLQHQRHGHSSYYNANTLNHNSFGPLGIPLIDVGLMALLDTVQILLVFISALHVPPTFSVILVQFTLPFAALLTQFVRPNGRFGYIFFRRQQDDTELSRHSSSTTTPATPSPNTHTTSTTAGTSTSGHQRQQAQHNTSGASSSISAVTIQPGTPLEGWGGLSAEHLWGSIIISVAVFLALLPALYSIFDPDFFIYADPIPIQTAYNTLLFVSSCIPAAASQLYKESVFLHHKQPVDSNYLNLLLSLFQFVIASLIAPLVYGLQGLEAKKHWENVYPASTFSSNFYDAAKCYLGVLDEQRALDAYADPAHGCSTFSLVWLVLLHVMSIIVVGVAVDKILQAGATKVMYRGISVGIILAVLSMYTYDLHIPDYNYGPAMDSLTLACLLLLIVGAEVYHRVSLQDAAFETIYPQIADNFYADGSGDP